MSSWYVFEPPRTAPDTLEAACETVLVKDGFSIGAFLLTPFWLLWRRMWLVFLLWLAAQVILLIFTLLLHLDESISGVVSLLFSLCFALDANALRAWSLRRKGWRFMGIVVGYNLDEAEQRHFAERTVIDPIQPPATPASKASYPGPSKPGEGHGGILGVFPEPQGTRP